MNLKHLTDKTLLNDTKSLVNKEREFLTKILHHLKEIDRRKLYSDLGYSSMFDYCVRELGYSEGNAQRRIQAARLLAEVPEIEAKIENGTLSLGNIGQASKFFRKNEIDTIEDKKEVLSQLENLSRKEGEKVLFMISGEEKEEKEIKRRVSSESVRLSIVLADSTIEKCEKLKGLLGRNMNYQELIDWMLDRSIETVEKRKFKSFSSLKSLPPQVAVNRVITAGVKGEVYRRDGKCTNCGSTWNLQFDHQLPFALGGSSETDNVRLLCFNCNQRARLRAGL